MYALISITYGDDEWGNTRDTYKKVVGLFTDKEAAYEYEKLARNNPPTRPDKWDRMFDPSRYRSDSVLAGATNYDIEFQEEAPVNPVIKTRDDTDVIAYYEAEPAKDQNWQGHEILVAVTRDGKRHSQSGHFYRDAAKAASDLNGRYKLTAPVKDTQG